jgi:hypothetical protein
MEIFCTPLHHCLFPFSAKHPSPSRQILQQQRVTRKQAAPGQGYVKGGIQIENP